MKKLLLCIFSLLMLSTIAQVPQGVGYQGVATDANGIELVNQSISIRASVLSGSATGTIEWEETHATSTDTFGLFTITIGQGTNTGNGVQADFADISWGTNTYFLKIEMDVNGGTNYAFMGTNQMMSVPYALYAESANINYDSISNFLSGDSTFITNVGSAMGGGGCDFQFPEGLHGEVISIDMLQGNYTVPNGKNFYILNAYSDVGETIINLDGNNFIKYNDIQLGSLGGNPMAGSGTTLSVHSHSSSPSFSMLYGLLIEKEVDFIAINMLQGNYTVPNGKNLYILNAYCNMGQTVINLDGNNFIKYGDPGFGLYSSEDISIAGSGSTLSVYSINSSPNHNMIYGYLADENYFANCGSNSNSNAGNSTDPVFPSNGSALNDSLLSGKRVYFISNGSNTGKIIESDINGSVTNVIYETTKHIQRIFLDEVNQDLYWIEGSRNSGSTTGTAIIKKSNILNFSASRVIISPHSLDNISDLWYSNLTSLVYWSVKEGDDRGKIFNNQNDLVNIHFDPNGNSGIKSFCINPSTGEIYYVINSDIYKVGQPNIIASAPGDITKMVYDPNNNAIILLVEYYGWKVKYLSLNNNTINDIIGEDDGFSNLYQINHVGTGLAIFNDSGTTKIFFSHMGYRIQKINFDGSNYEVILGTHESPYSITTDQ